MHRYTPIDPIRLAQRVATMISYGLGKREVADQLAEEGISHDDAQIAWSMAKMMLKWEQEST